MLPAQQVACQEYLDAVNELEARIERKRGLDALLPNCADAVLLRFRAGSIERALWSTLMMTRMAADIAA
jgi:hypothetical protein